MALQRDKALLDGDVQNEDVNKKNVVRPSESLLDCSVERTKLSLPKNRDAILEVLP